jgi:threonylcarbamoyladenosine tRNA methylthiotransferase MtaB
MTALVPSLKVQDGCYPCAYCNDSIGTWSKSTIRLKNVVKAAQEIALPVVWKEIVLTGVNIGDFGLRNGKREETFLDY